MKKTGAAFILAGVLVAHLALSSCEGVKPAGSPIPESTFVNLYAERLVVQNEIRLTRGDSAALRLRVDSLYARYHVTHGEVNEALLRYQEDLQEWRRFHDLVVRKLEQFQQEGTTERVK